MKFIALLWSVYLLALFTVPCCAYDDCRDETTSQHSSSKGSADSGTCSPFFQCDKCATSPVIVEHGYHIPSLARVQRVYASFLSRFIPDVHYDFWHPPQLA